MEDKNQITSMSDLREWIAQCIVPGQKITAEEVCRALSYFTRREKKIAYGNLGRLCKDGTLTRDDYKYGGYRRAVNIEEYDLTGEISEDEISFNVKLPLDLHNLLSLKRDQLLQVSGRYDACKSSLLFQIEADNYLEHKIIHIISDEWGVPAIKERMDILGIPRPHENIKVMPMVPGWEEMIPRGKYLVLIDYLRADQNPFETDTQIQRILKKLDGGIAIFATQKHPGLDRPVGGQFAVHACHHIIMLDRYRNDFLCKIYRTKNIRNLEGYYKTFELTEKKRLISIMHDWKPGQIRWEKDPKPK